MLLKLNLHIQNVITALKHNLHLVDNNFQLSFIVSYAEHFNQNENGSADIHTNLNRFIIDHHIKIHKM